jgi:alcohol dehydrogenase
VRGCPGYALIQVRRAGVCNTDLELMKGYMGFTGVLGHEFVGVVVNVCPKDDKDDTDDDTDLQHWIGRRVCGDINVACGNCRTCVGRNDDERRCLARNHCPHRSVLGILKRDGTMAEYLTLPVRNLHVVPDDMPDEVAVFAEPVAAACRIVEQHLISYDTGTTDAPQQQQQHRVDKVDSRGWQIGTHDCRSLGP